MKRISISLVLALAAPLMLCPLAAADNQSPTAVQSTEKADKALLNRLIRQVRRIDRDTEELMDRAMAEARNNGGSADPATKAQLLSGEQDNKEGRFRSLLEEQARIDIEEEDLFHYKVLSLISLIYKILMI